MSCSGYFEVLLHQEEEKRFKEEQLRLQEIEEAKLRQKKKILNLQVQGNFHKANREQAKLEKQTEITERMKQLLGEAPK